MYTNTHTPTYSFFFLTNFIDFIFEGEFLESLSSTTASKQSRANLQLVYPTVENVRNCLEGYNGGGSLPYQQQTALKQPYLPNFMHAWVAERTKRTRAMPHMKSYGLVSFSFHKTSNFKILTYLYFRSYILITRSSSRQK